jgi:hypothetical protein
MSITSDRHTTGGELSDTVDAMLADHLANAFGDEAMALLQQKFRTEHVARLRGFCPPALFAPLRDEALGLVDEFGVVHDFRFAVTGNTPRHMTTVGQPVIKERGALIHATYFSAVVKEFLSRVTGESLSTCPYAGEHYVISRLTRSGDTHGWHWDDYSYGFVLVLEAPDYRDGGFVQAVPNTAWDKDDPDVNGALLNSCVRSYALSAGDAYVMKTDTTMHRVFPISGTSRRTIVNMTFACPSDLSRPMTHETNDALFGGAAPHPASSR